ncbi:pseudouridine synthase [Ammoniphilus resinae]|nr:pseudouridine synthase [Ammoniphilus resinae]
MEERLQKVLAAAGIASRRKCEDLILQGRVKVNHQTITQLGHKVSDSDHIEVDGKPISREKFVYFLFHKPTGVITSLNDPQGRKIVTDFFKEVKQRVYPVGRLDYDTSGLLLLMNDGELANQIAHPRFEIDKVYIATVKGYPSEKTLERLRKGIILEDGPTAPAEAKLLEMDEKKGQAVIELTIHEGRNRQVRRMCQTVGHPVIKLKRVRLGFLTLGELKMGEYRPLTAKEVQQLKSMFASGME